MPSFVFTLQEFAQEILLLIDAVHRICIHESRKPYQPWTSIMSYAFATRYIFKKRQSESRSIRAKRSLGTIPSFPSFLALKDFKLPCYPWIPFAFLKHFRMYGLMLLALFKPHLDPLFLSQGD